jgi:hypothetical protein
MAGLLHFKPESGPTPLAKGGRPDFDELGSTELTGASRVA